MRWYNNNNNNERREKTHTNTLKNDRFMGKLLFTMPNEDIFESTIFLFITVSVYSFVCPVDVNAEHQWRCLFNYLDDFCRLWKY